MFPLEDRQNLMRRAADTLTDPNFLALMSLGEDEVNGGSLGVEARIREVGDPIYFYFKLMSGRFNPSDHYVFYIMNVCDKTFEGRLTLAEDFGDIKGALYLDHIILQYSDDERLKHRVRTTQKKKRGNITAFFNHRDNGEVRLSSKDYKMLQYWVPTSINHIGYYADEFLKGYRGLGNTSNEVIPLFNSYRKDAPHNSPQPHFRKSYERVIQKDDKVITTSVTGAFVNVDWSKCTNEEVSEMIAQRSDEIFSQYFYSTLLPHLKETGHDADLIERAYNSGEIFQTNYRES